MFYVALTKDKQIIEAHSSNSTECDNSKLDEIRKISLSHGFQEDEFDISWVTNDEWTEITKLQVYE
jgi:hypothetical protein